MKDTAVTGPFDIYLLVVAIDGDCKGHRERIRELRKYARGHPLKNKVVYAVADPHIERWYMIDQRAFKDGVGVDRAPDMPPYKCEKDYYKKLLHHTLAEARVISLLGAAEYAEKIVASMASIENLFHQDAGFESFIRNLRTFFRTRTD